MKNLPLTLDPSDIFVALDPGLKHTGVAIGNRERVISLSTCSITHTAEAELPHIMAKGIMAFTRAFVHKAVLTSVVLEDYAMGAGRFNIYQAELVGILKNAFWATHRIPVYSLPQTTGRKLVAGAGNATKAAVAKALAGVLPEVKYFSDWERHDPDKPTAKKLRFHATDAAAVHIGFSKYVAEGNISDSFYRRSLI